MGKKNSQGDFKKRAKGKNKKKNTFKKYGKNTSRGLRIKQADMEKKAEKRKDEGDHHLVEAQMKFAKTKGKYSGGAAKSICKITCRKKKHGS